MAREQMVRLSDHERELVEECREIMYGRNADDVPLGMVIGDLAERFEERQQ